MGEELIHFLIFPRGVPRAGGQGAVPPSLLGSRVWLCPRQGLPVLAAYACHCAQEGAPSPWRNQTLC